MNTFENTNTTCTCPFFPLRRETMVTPVYNRDLAAYWQSFGLSTTSLWLLLLSIWYGHEGALHDLNRDPIDLWTPDEFGDDYIDRLAKDPVRSLRRYLEFAEGTRVNRLRKEHHNLAMMLGHARNNRQCVQTGLCSGRIR